MSHNLRLRPFAALALAVAAACGSSGEDASSSGSSVTVVDEPPGANCPAGGKRLIVQNEGQSPTTSYVCNGVPAGGGSAVSVIPEPPGPYCPAGGQRIVSVDAQTGQPQVSFVCNGMPAMATHLPWEVASASTVAVPNQGYFTVGATKVTVTLPVSPYLLPGDAVEVEAVGAGGFAVVPGAGQQILFSQDVVPFPGNVWTPRDVARSWGPVVSSATGAVLAAAADLGSIDVSTDYGASWTSTGPAGVTARWSALAASRDGTRLFAATPTDGGTAGRLYVSLDTGAHWSQCTAVTGDWSGLSVSADGTQLAATMRNDSIWIITNIVSVPGGASCATSSWRDSHRAWSAVTSSADGSMLVAAVRGGQLYMSMDSGLTWTARESSRNWEAVASSRNGARVVAAANAAVGQGQLYASDDFGHSWAPLGGSGWSWSSLAMSDDGTRLAGIACTAPTSCQVMESADGGARWLARDGAVRPWSGVASSADGLRLVAAARSDRLYTTAAPSGTSALLEGLYGSRLQVRYAGPNTWIVSDDLGVILAF